MVVFIADCPSECTAESKEEEIFYALKENLPDDEEYYVFHSFHVTNVVNNVIHPKEIDFVIFNPKKGIICIEAKAGGVYTQRDEYGLLKWHYASGLEIKKGGPYRQAEVKKISLIDRFKKSNCSALLNTCKIHHAVWFVSLTKSQLDNIVLTPEASQDITLTFDDLKNPAYAFNKIYNLNTENKVETNLSEYDKKRILENVLCPEFNLVPSMASELSIQKTQLVRLLKEQTKILDFLEDQQIATINGAGGTGKTMIALEKARRHANNNEKVLFLCYNKNLCHYLRENYSYTNIDFYNIDAFACAYCKTDRYDYELLKEKIEEDFLNQEFPYQHIIIDEGQDFGQIEIEKNNILETLEAAVVNEDENTGSFYVFYDKQQFIQGETCPKFIENADCRLTLTKNCRNTFNIAETSTRPLNLKKKVKTNDDGVLGETAVAYISDNKEKNIEHLELAIKKCLEKKINEKEIVILSSKTKEDFKNGNSLLSDYGEYYSCFGKNFKISNSSDFKGLEADAVILIDVDTKTFETLKNRNRFYVATSRAKFNLYLICHLSKEECCYLSEIIKEKNYDRDSFDIKDLDVSKIKNPEKRFAAALNATLQAG